LHLIDRIAHSSRWSQRPTGEKLLISLGGLVACLGGPPLIIGPIILVLYMGLALGSARILPKLYFSILLLPIGFLIASTPMLLISVDFSNGFTIGWRPDQIPVALALVARAAGATACLVLLALTTPVHAIVPVLRRLGLPAFLVEIILLTYRLIFVFAETAANGYQAQAARLGYSNWKQGLHSLGQLAAALFQRSMERAKHLEVGLSARGFEGNLPVLSEDRNPASPIRCLFILLCLAGVLMFSLYVEAVIHV
jgi:cobalt/nickel transport system permease protein